MPAAQINITLGTAGHIDHGKTALVKSLTGCNTDRLKEEQERGMSIDLGYAPCTIADLEVGLVDVPGHENFIKTMVAGANGMDGVIFVVAADDGVMPQTCEHLEILTLLGLRHGIVALTKIDRVPGDQLAPIRADLAELLRGTFLESAPIVGVSNVTGAGFDEFYEQLATLVHAIEPRRSDGVFRIPLDRAFSAQGFGTVVAGIPVSGLARIGDQVVLLPQQWPGQVRRIEAYGRGSDTARAGQCVAINVGHWDHRGIHRGDTVTLPGYFAPADWFVCDLRLLPHANLTLKSGAHVTFHSGTSAVAAAIYPVQGDRLQGGQTCLVQIRTQQPVVAAPGDPFILRTPSPVRTVGGGTVVEAMARRLPRNRPDHHQDLAERARAIHDERRFMEYCLQTAPALAASPADLALRAKVLPGRGQEIVAALVREGKALALAQGLYIHRDTASKAAERIVQTLQAFHRQTPESPGMAPDQLRQAAKIDKPVADALVALLQTQGRLVQNQQRLATAEHRATFRDEDARLLEAIETQFRQQAMSPPAPEEVAAALGADSRTMQRLLRILGEHGRLVQVAEGLLFHREAIEHAREVLVAHLTKEGRLESVQFKYLLNTTRKYAIPLLDYFDRVGLTRRDGYTRYLKTPPGGKGKG